MQLALTAEVLVPLGVGVLVVLAALVLVVRSVRRRRSAARGVRDGPAQPSPQSGSLPDRGPGLPSETTPGRAAEAAAADPPGTEGPHLSPDRNGSGRTVAAAVAQALAQRAAVQRTDSAGPPADDPDRAAAALLSGGDARDRLLAVLLDDPVRAVGATVELETCRGQLERLADAMRHERRALGEVLSRLEGAGLAPEQLSRLAGLPLDEVRVLLAPTGTRNP